MRLPGRGAVRRGRDGAAVSAHNPLVLLRVHTADETCNEEGERVVRYVIGGYMDLPQEEGEDLPPVFWVHSREWRAVLFVTWLLAQPRLRSVPMGNAQELQEALMMAAAGHLRFEPLEEQGERR